MPPKKPRGERGGSRVSRRAGTKSVASRQAAHRKRLKEKEARKAKAA